MRIFIIIGLLIGLILEASGSTMTKVGTTAAPFLEIGIGSRASALGGAFVALADDASALYWNPAGLARMATPQMIFSRTQWLADINLNYAGAIVPLGVYGAVGLSGTFMNSGDMDVRTILQQEGTGEKFQVSDICLGVAYALNLTDRFSLGFNAKYIQQKIAHCESRAMALDIGTLFITQWHGLRLGASLYNFGTAMKMQGQDLMIYYDPDATKTGNNDKIISYQGTDEWELPMNFQAGLAVNVVERSYHRLSLSVDLLHPSNNSESINAGLEYGLNRLVFLRCGWASAFQKDSEEGATFGAGLKKRLGGSYLVIDYAYSDFSRLENTQRFSFIFQF
ncbi:MAG: PorV/PorQ family protein [Candidatus Delongbacteria bacterium]|nr:PorV/PorQ family protein [Candidatus Delongbacteria bacterium]